MKQLFFLMIFLCGGVAPAMAQNDDVAQPNVAQPDVAAPNDVEGENAQPNVAAPDQVVGENAQGNVAAPDDAQGENARTVPAWINRPADDDAQPNEDLPGY